MWFGEIPVRSHFIFFSIPGNGEFEVPSSFVSGLSSGARPKTTNTSGKKKQKSKEKSKNNQSKTNHSKSNVEQRKKEYEGFKIVVIQMDT